MRDRILSAIAGARSRLNLAIVAHRALAWAIPSAGAAAAVGAVLRFAGLDAAGLVAWAGLVAIGAAIGAARGMSARMSTADAARWLDERLGSEELLSASLVCLARGRSGRFDDEILAGAEGQAALAAEIRPPIRPTARKAALALAAATASALALVLARPIDPFLSEGGAAGRRAAAPSEARAKASASESESREAASALAASLFPDDKRMATLAQRALREGRLDDFQDILRGAELELSSRIDRTVSELEKKKLTRERDRVRDAMNSMIASASAEDRDAGRDGSPGGGSGQDSEGAGDRGDEGSGGSVAPGPGEGSERGGASAEQGEGGSGGEEGAAGSGGESGGEDGGKGGQGWGTGSGSPRSWGEIEPKAGGDSASLDLTDDASFFELVLPGDDASAPLASVIPGSRRAAESAMSREGVPLEYRDFVRSYFMALSKGATE
jgi:hypothetical protein